MKIKRLSALALCMALMMVMTGCEVVSVNREKDMAQVVAEVGEWKMTKQEIYDEVDALVASQGIDIFDENLSAEARAWLDENMLPLLEEDVESEIIRQKAAEMNIALTEEEQTEAEEEVQSYVDMVKQILGYDEENQDEDSYEGEDIEADVDAYFEENGMSRQEYLDTITMSTLTEHLKEEVTKDVSAAEEDIKKKYDEDLKAQKDVFNTDAADEPSPSPSATATDDATEAPLLDDGATATDPDTAYQELAKAGTSSSSTYVLYKPAGYRVVKHILLEFTEEDQAKIEEAEGKITELEEKISPTQESISEAEAAVADAEARIAELKGESEPDETASPEATASADPSASPDASTSPETSEMTEEEKQKAIADQEELIADKKAEIDILTKGMAPDQAAISDAEAEVETLRQMAGDNLQSTVDDIKKRYSEGEEFDKLIEEFNTDPGMESVYGMAYGYLLAPENTDFIEEFNKASFQLAKEGDLSEPVLSDYGVHVIRLEMGDDAADVPYEKAKQVVKDVLDAEAIGVKWDEMMEQWKKDMGAKIYENRLKFIK